MTAARGSTLAPRPVPPEADTLQSVYDRGNTISVDGNPGAILFENSTDGVDVLQINRSFAGGGDGLQVTMGAATTGDAIKVDMVAGATGAALRIAQGANNYWVWGATGSLVASPSSGQSVAVTTSGAGTILFTATAALCGLAGNNSSTIQLGTNGNVLIRAASAQAVAIGSNGVSTHIACNTAGAITLSPTSTRDCTITLAGASGELVVESSTVASAFVLDLAGDLRRGSTVAATVLFANGGVNVGSGEGWRTVQTTDATVTTIVTIPTAADKNYTILADVSGLQSGGANGVGYVRAATLRNDSGTITQVGATTSVHTAEDAALAACDVTFAISGTSILVRVTGIAATTIDWKARVRVTEN